jgi:TatD DNase family protein
MNHELSTKFIDTHCHLDFPEFDQDRDEVIQRARNQGIGCIINIGSSLQGSKRAVELAALYDSVYATVGLHPHEADSFNKEAERIISDLAKNEKVVAIGETGLDYFKNYSSPENQKPLFLALIHLAKELNLPLVIHNRQAEPETLKILKETMPVRAVIHCFSGDEVFLKECLDLGFLVSFTCNITYKKADRLRGLVKLAPLERLMLETDAPFLAPEGFRGKRNEPAYVKMLAGEIAKIKQVAIEEVAAVTTENAKKFFNIP